MITTAFEPGGREKYETLELRRWAHMLGFRGHFLTKSRCHSVTFAALRGERRSHRIAAGLAGLERDTDDPHSGGYLIDPSSVTVINNWWPVQFGHRGEGERELAAAIAERHLAQRRSKIRPPGRAA